jgi:hypothetical protein
MKNKGQRAMRTTKAIGLDDRWGTLYISNLTAGTSVVPGVNGCSFYADVPATAHVTNTLVAAIRDRAGE